MNAWFSGAVVRMAGFLLPLAGATVLALSGACAPSSDATESAATGQAEIVTGCEVFDVRKNRNMTPEELKTLRDPIATQVLSAETCPTKLDGIRSSLSKCSKSKQAAFQTFTLSERSFLFGQLDNEAIRGVTQRTCDAETDAFMSIFGIDIGAASLPQENTEVVGFDKTAGVFDFYVHENNRWNFMGSSNDAVADGYTCDANGACLPKSAGKARCWACHESGGLNMKELRPPWVGWDGGIGDMPGQKALFEKFPALQSRGAAPDLEVSVETGNAVWARTRVETLKNLDTAELLRPLFCTLTMQLDASQTFLSGSFFATPTFAKDKTGAFANAPFIDVEFSQANYTTLTSYIGQRVVDQSDKPLVGKNGSITDTPGGFFSPARGDADDRYIIELITQNVVDTNFVNDVLAIDFTRPIFSPTRCGLVEKAPKLAPADMTPENIRAGFIQTLRNEPRAGAAALLASLQSTAKKDHDAPKAAFLAACAARPQRQLLADVLMYNAHLKFAARAHKIATPGGKMQGFIEFNETMPVDSLPDTDKGFDPVTCALVSPPPPPG